jgi:tetratricopeptide (TPR) repeat protein/cold shock CspA family protein
VLFHLSRVQRDLGDFEAATDALDACRRLDALTDPPAIRPEHLLACQGELALRRGDYVSARDLFFEARDLDPGSSYVWERLGRVHELLGAHGEARAAYERAVALPRGGFAHLSLGRFHLQITQDLPAAATALATALREVQSTEPLVRLELARLHLACDRVLAAHEQVNQALACRRDGGFAEGLRLAAQIAERIGRYQEAAGHLRQLSRIGVDDGTLLARAETLEQAAPPPPPGPDPPLPVPLARLDDGILDFRGRDRVSGVVDRFFAEKGFGFVRYGSGQTLFFHVTQCPDGVAHIEPGTSISFVVGHNPKKGKPQAEAIKFGD